MRGGKSRRGGRSTTKNDRTAAWFGPLMLNPVPAAVAFETVTLEPPLRKRLFWAIPEDRAAAKYQGPAQGQAAACGARGLWRVGKQ